MLHDYILQLFNKPIYIIRLGNCIYNQRYLFVFILRKYIFFLEIFITQKYVFTEQIKCPGTIKTLEFVVDFPSVKLTCLN